MITHHQQHTNVNNISVWTLANFTHHNIPVSRARPTGSAFLAHGFLLDADVLDGVVELVLGALVIGLLLSLVVL